MKFTFMSTTGFDFDPGTPLAQPLGGTESAAAYLSAALVRAGAKVTLLNNTPVERYAHGVHIANFRSIPRAALDDCDLFVMISAAAGRDVRRALKDNVPMVLWCHVDINQPIVSRLKQQEEVDSWTRYVMVSKWQAERFVKHFSVPENNIEVIGNAVSPAFLDQPVSPAWFEVGAAPSLAYTSTPFRGLDILLECFPSIRERVPDARLKIHSSMNIYGVGLERDPHRYLYTLARSLPGIDYVGPVSQAALARSLQDVAALAYPNTFMETSCISVMEAMASGSDVLTVKLGALPETLNGFGRTISWETNRSPEAGANAFIDLVVESLNEAKNNPSAAAEKRRARIEFARSTYTWDARAQQWLALAKALNLGK